MKAQTVRTWRALRINGFVPKFLMTALFLTVILFGVYCAGRAGINPNVYSVDFNVYYKAWQSVLVTGGNPYTEQISPATPYLYPPLFAIVFGPLGLISLQASAFCWYAIGLASFIASLIFSRKIIGNPGPHKIAAWVVLLAIAPVLRFVLDNLRMGQVNLLVVFLTIFGLYLVSTSRKWPAAVAIGAAISIKLTPALFIIYFLIKGDWRQALRTAMAGAVMTIGPFLLMGRQGLAAFNHWYGLVVLNQQGFDWADHGNQSLRALVDRLFTGDSTGLDYLPHINIINNHPLAAFLYFAGAAVILILIAVTARAAFSPTQADNHLANMLEYGMIFCAMLIISNLSWRDHFVALLVPYAALLRVVQVEPERWRRKLTWSVLGISFGLCTVTTSVVIGRRAAEISDAFSAQFLGVVALFLGLFYLRIRLGSRGVYARTEREVSDEFSDRVEEGLHA